MGHTTHSRRSPHPCSKAGRRGRRPRSADPYSPVMGDARARGEAAPGPSENVDWEKLCGCHYNHQNHRIAQHRLGRVNHTGIWPMARRISARITESARRPEL